MKRETIRLVGEGWALRCTTDHPLYDPTTREWADAGDWALGKRTTLLLVGDGAEAPRQATVRERHLDAGVAELIDLSVVHALHNFVAEGILVHNKPPVQAQCTLPGASIQVTEDSACTCLDGTVGVVRCNLDAAASGQCVNCAGTDAGVDGGTDGG